MSLETKLAILSDAAKYDASCASSGGERRDSRKGGIGSSGGAGICHAYTPDGQSTQMIIGANGSDDGDSELPYQSTAY